MDVSATATATIFCGKCGGRTDVEATKIGEKNTYAYCPLCGASESLDVAIRG